MTDISAIGPKELIKGYCWDPVLVEVDEVVENFGLEIRACQRLMLYTICVLKVSHTSCLFCIYVLL